MSLNIAEQRRLLHPVGEPSAFGFTVRHDDDELKAEIAACEADTAPGISG